MVSSPADFFAVLVLIGLLIAGLWYVKWYLVAIVVFIILALIGCGQGVIGNMVCECQIITCSCVGGTNAPGR